MGGGRAASGLAGGRGPARARRPAWYEVRERAARAWRGGCLQLAALAAGAAALGCEITEVEIAASEDIVIAEVVALVQQNPAGAPTLAAFAYLHRTLDQSRDPRVSGAVVRIKGASGGEVVLAEQDAASDCVGWGVLEDDTPGGTVSVEPVGAGTCYRGQAAPSPFAPGDRLELEVAAADGRTLTATSQMPGAFAFAGVAQEAGACRMEPDANLRVSWTEAADAWAYFADARVHDLAAALADRDFEAPDSLDLLGLAIGREDTEIIFPRDMGLFDFFDADPNVQDAIRELREGLPAGARADISLVAADRNWVNWVRRGNFNPSGEVRIPSVFGDGTGVFATGTQRRLKVTTRAGEGGTAPPCGPAVD